MNIAISTIRYRPTPKSRTERQHQAHKALVKNYFVDVRELGSFILQQLSVDPESLKTINNKLAPIEKLALALNIPFKDIHLSQEFQAEAKTLYKDSYKSIGRIKFFKDTFNENQDELDNILKRLEIIRENLAHLKNNITSSDQELTNPDYVPIVVEIHQEPSSIDKLKASCSAIKANAEMQDTSLASRLALISEISDSVFEHLDEIIGLKKKDNYYCENELRQALVFLNTELRDIDTSHEQGMQDYGMLGAVLNNLEFFVEWFNNNISEKQTKSSPSATQPVRLEAVVQDSYKEFANFKQKFRNEKEKLLSSLKKITEEKFLRKGLNQNHATVKEKLESIYNSVQSTNDISYKRYALKKLLETYCEYSQYFDKGLNKTNPYHVDDYRYKLSLLSSCVFKVALLATDSQLLKPKIISKINNSLQASNFRPNAWKQQPLVAVQTVLGKALNDQNIEILRRSLAKFIFTFKNTLTNNSVKAQQLIKVFGFLDQVIKSGRNGEAKNAQVILEQAILNATKVLETTNSYELEAKFTRDMSTQLKSLSSMKLETLDLLCKQILLRKTKFGLNPDLESKIVNVMNTLLENSEKIVAKRKKKASKPNHGNKEQVIDIHKKQVINDFLQVLTQETT